MTLTREQMVEMLEHDEDTDLWLLDYDTETGGYSTLIVPGQDDITEFQQPGHWPRFICRSLTVNQFVDSFGEERALAIVNQTIESTIVQRMTPSTAARLVIQALRRKASQ